MILIINLSTKFSTPHLRTAFSGNASTLSLKRKYISPETQVRFPSNAEAF